MNAECGMLNAGRRPFIVQHSSFIIPNSFPLEQGLLSLDAPAIAAKLPIAADDAMARNNHRQRIGRARTSHGPSRLWAADAASNSRIGGGRAGRGLLQRPPHSPLKYRSLDVKRELQFSTRRFEVRHQLATPLSHRGIAADELRLGKSYFAGGRRDDPAILQTRSRTRPCSVAATSTQPRDDSEIA